MRSAFNWLTHHFATRRPSIYAIEPIKALYIFAIANLVSAVFAPIQDCDETFNYWEPAHYLSHGYGLQTWEYSPDFTIRSWLYIALYAIPGNLRRILPHPNKVRSLLRPFFPRVLTTDSISWPSSTLFDMSLPLSALCVRRSCTR